MNTIHLYSYLYSWSKVAGHTRIKKNSFPKKGTQQCGTRRTRLPFKEVGSEQKKYRAMKRQGKIIIFLFWNFFVPRFWYIRYKKAKKMLKKKWILSTKYIFRCDPFIYLWVCVMSIITSLHPHFLSILKKCKWWMKFFSKQKL